MIKALFIAIWIVVSPGYEIEIVTAGECSKTVYHNSIQTFYQELDCDTAAFLVEWHRAHGSWVKD
jgi:hypothetical protein